ncbi:histidinol-phosphatase HisJ [Salimicrobium sp. PL1-032A]|uniref:histidinol-phosphatase HisJ n=1 Tax=Salimicrobium sp. PL1-032A TaxID=3095364 RepID=UPI003261D21D
MEMKEMEQYLKAIDEVKAAYRKDLTILTGLEVDYIEGYENETRAFLNEYGPHLEDSILSVHFLKGQRNWHCIDFSPDAFERAFKDIGGIRETYAKYYEQLRRSVHADLGDHKPGRIGHMSLIRKFHQLHPSPSDWVHMAKSLLPVIKQEKMTLDYNGAGYKKEHCREPYPPVSIAQEAYELGIPLVYGSDAHTASGLNAGRAAMKTGLIHNTD